MARSPVSPGHPMASASLSRPAAGAVNSPDVGYGVVNPYAAVPSLHFGWALWCGTLLWSFARRPAVRALSVNLLTVGAFVAFLTARKLPREVVADHQRRAPGRLANPRCLPGASQNFCAGDPRALKLL